MTRAARVIGGVLLALCSGCAIEFELDTRFWMMDYPGGVSFDVEHYAITLDIDPIRREIEAGCTIRLWPSGTVFPEPFHRPDDFDSVVDLHFDGFEIRSVSDAAGNLLVWARERDRLRVHLASPLQPGNFEEITVRYFGSPRAGLWFGRERDGVPTQVFTHGECLEARSWFPCRDQPADRATSEIRVTMPTNWTSIAAGERIERIENGERATELWRMTFPHPSYLETLVAGEFTVEHDEWDGVPLEFVCAQENKAFLRETFAETGAILAYFSELTGVRYPFAKYTQTCVDNFPLGGMENVSATTLTDTMLPDEQGMSDEAPRDLIAHEAAHQWFGDLVTCWDWSDAWLNEGFATYFAALYEEHAAGRDAFECTMRGIRDAYLARDVGAYRRPIVEWQWNPLGAFFTGHVYQGGATRLHYLRGVLGDEMFFAGIRRYLASNRGQAVNTDSLRTAFEAVSGRDLEPFFEQWLRTRGHPEVETWWSFDAQQQRIVLTIEQTQREADNTKTAFDIELDVEIATERGARVERAHLDRRRTQIQFACDTEPAWVRVDPRDFVPMKLDEHMSAKPWMALATHGDTSGRLRAIGVLERSRGGELKAHEIDVVEEMLLKFAAEDENADVRRAALVALSRSVSAKRRGAARELFLYAGRNDVSRDVKFAAIHALRSCGRDAEVHDFAERALTRTEGWNLRGEIVGLIAASAPDEAFAYLERALETRSAHGTFEARVLTELFATKDPRARGILLAWLRDETKPDAARAVAVRELTRSHLQHGELEAVIDLLASPRIRMRREAIAALATSEDTRARTALERHAASHPSAIEMLTTDEALERSTDEP